MPGGQYDSSKTRVVPVFSALSSRRDPWLRELLELPGAGQGEGRIPRDLDLTLLAGHWGNQELGLSPPVGLLEWMLDNPSRLRRTTSRQPDRLALFTGSEEALARARGLLRSTPTSRAWYVLEGKTFPDVVIETPDALVVVEGKRTEPGPTTYTTWLEGRHQIWRHIDAAWEIRGRKRVFGFFVVEGEERSDAVPAVWQQAAIDCLSSDVLATSFPHRSEDERAKIADCFLGVTTWQAICRRFGLSEELLVRTVQTGD